MDNTLDHGQVDSLRIATKRRKTINTSFCNSYTNSLAFYSFLQFETKPVIVRGETFSVLSNTLFVAVDTSLVFKCRYSTNVPIASTNFSLNPSESSNTKAAFGVLNDGFDFDIYSDRSFHNLLSLTARAVIGATAFGRVKWSITTLSGKVEFFIKNCNVNLASITVPIIKDNCYARIVNTKMEQTEHKQNEESIFSYKVFGVDRYSATGDRMNVVCDLKICKTDDPKCNINHADHCDQLIKDYMYSFNGM